MQSDPSAPLPAPDKSAKKSNKRLFLLAIPVAVAVVGSGVLVASANAGGGTPIPGVVEAESYAAHSGAQTEGTNDTGGGRNVGWLSNGDWMRYDDVDLGAAGSALTVEARVASANTDGGTVEVRQGSATGELLAAFPITKTGSWQDWVTGTAVSPTTLNGKQTVVVNLVSKSRNDFVNLNWLRFTRGGTAGTPSASASVSASVPASASPSTPAAPSAPVSVSPTPTGTTPQTGNGWVVMDQAMWAREMAAFRAITPKTPPERMVPEFNVACAISHTAPDDPIVFPGLKGASHDHTFWGNKSTSAVSTPESLFANKSTTCKPATEDFSAYWVPTLLKDGKPVMPKDVTVYYGSRSRNYYAETVPFPSGFRMIVGDAKQQTGDTNWFGCAPRETETGRTANGEWPVCSSRGELLRQLMFPDCWDGVHLDSPDHKSHVGPADNNGRCVGKFPVAIPSVSYMLAYPLNTDTEGVRLSSGTGFSIHGDFVNGWEPQALAERVRNCLNQNAKCNSAGGF